MRKLYDEKLIPAEMAANLLYNGDNVALGMSVSQAPAIMRAVANRVRAGKLSDLNVYYQHGGSCLNETILAADLQDAIHPHCLFFGHHDRESAVPIEYIPCMFHQSAKLLLQERKVDTFIVAVSPMNEAGYFSFGVNADYAMTLARKCSRVIVEVNEFMPFVSGHVMLHVSEVTAIVEHSAPLMEVPTRPATMKDRMIANQIGPKIRDGATIQLGIGGVPAAVADILKDRNDLGLHTELFSPAIMRLIKAGNINGRRKTLLPYKHVFTIALADTETYEYMGHNRDIVGYPVDWVNDPHVIAQNDNMVSVNAAIEVDLTGQVNAETMQGRHWSGPGGQLDFVRGAYASPGGASFIALYSTAKGDSISRIVPQLTSPATDPRMDVHWVVTEYGAVNLKGLTMSQRAERLIQIAHPKFRDELRVKR